MKLSFGNSNIDNQLNRCKYLIPLSIHDHLIKELELRESFATNLPFNEFIHCKEEKEQQSKFNCRMNLIIVMLLPQPSQK